MSLEYISPTRINLIQTKKTLALAESGREILERKRDILIRELRHSIYDAERTRDEMNAVLAKAFQSLKEANIASGSDSIENASMSTTFKADFLLDYRSIMGVTVPIIELQSEPEQKPNYGFAGTNAALDNAFKLFNSLLDLISELARNEGTTFQIANDIRKTQRRVNALNHVLIPDYRETVKRIELVLEEREREEFVRMKRIKKIIREREV